jgi:hypothetical protein
LILIVILQKNSLSMKKFLLIIMLIMILVFTHAQNYHTLVDTNKLWSIKHQYGLTPFSDFTKFQGEEMFQGNIYKKVWTTTDTTLANWNFSGYIREDADKQVYIRTWSGGPDDLRYDFGVEAGDTVYLFYDPIGIYFTIDSVDTLTLITGETRKRINLSCYAGPGGFMGNDTWIEGIGSLYGVMQSGSCALAGDMPQLICFEENDTLKYFNDNFDNCYIVTGIATNNPITEQVRIFPNPSSGLISLKIDDPLILPMKVTFYDPLGNQILEKEVTDIENKIDIIHLKSSCLIFYQLTGTTSFYGSGKILVQVK